MRTSPGAPARATVLVMPRPTATPAQPFRLGRWVAYVVAGESVGFLIPASGFAIAYYAGLAPWQAYVLHVVLGLGEGALLGLAQALALRGTRGQVPTRRWVAVTAVAAALAWGIGMLPTTLFDSGVTLDPANALVWIAAAGGAVALLLTIPVAQWTVLRHVLDRAWHWIPVNAAAWLVGLSFTLLPSPFVDETTPPTVLAVAFGLGGVAMATTVAVGTGVGMRRMLANQSRGAGREGGN